jgi:arylsulfatase A-like enzyme
MDDAIAEIITALKDTDMMDNTSVIFASDNGGCYMNGGKNGPFKGGKAALFEGGVKVDAFIYAPELLESSASGTVYSNLFHVSDWFPTILDMAGISYTAPSG